MSAEAVPLTDTPDESKPFLAGTLTVYLRSNGSAVMVTDFELNGVPQGVQRQVIPRQMVEFGLGKMFGGSGGGLRGKARALRAFSRRQEDDPIRIAEELAQQLHAEEAVDG